MGKSVWPDRIDQVKDMLKTNSVDDVAEHYGINRGSFLTVCKNYGIPVKKKKPQRDPVKNEEITGQNPRLLKLRDQLLRRAWV